MDDLISKRDAIEAVNDALAEYIPTFRPWQERIPLECALKIKALPPVQPTITHEQAIDYLHETGWLQNHDRILTKSRVPLKGTWKDFTDEGYVECPFCKSATNCESKEEIDDIHFCFSCGAMLKRGEADATD